MTGVAERDNERPVTGVAERDRERLAAGEQLLDEASFLGVEPPRKPPLGLLPRFAVATLWDSNWEGCKESNLIRCP